MYTKYKVNLIIQLGLDIKDSVQLGLSQNNTPWVHPGSHMWRNYVFCATLRTCILRFADFVIIKSLFEVFKFFLSRCWQIMKNNYVK